jgi:hypothetical protein
MMNVQVFESKLIRSDEGGFSAWKILHRIKAGNWHSQATQACPYPKARYPSHGEGWILSNSYYSNEAECKHSFDRLVALLGDQP